MTLPRNARIWIALTMLPFAGACTAGRGTPAPTADVFCALGPYRPGGEAEIAAMGTEHARWTLQVNEAGAIACDPPWRP